MYYNPFLCVFAGVIARLSSLGRCWIFVFRLDDGKDLVACFCVDSPCFIYWLIIVFIIKKH